MELLIGFGNWGPWLVVAFLLLLLVGLAFSTFEVGQGFDLFFQTNNPAYWQKVLIALAAACVIILGLIAISNWSLSFTPQLWVGVLLLVVLFWEPVFLSMGICALVGWRLPHVDWKAGMLLGVPFGISTVFLFYTTSWLNPLDDLKPGITSHWMMPLYPIPGTLTVTAAPVTLLIVWSIWKRTPVGNSFDFFEHWDKAERAFLKWKLKVELKLKRR